MKTRFRKLNVGFLMIIFALLFIAGCSSQSVVKENLGKQVIMNLNGVYKKKVSINYLLYLPKDYEQKEELPLLLFLHGAGERGNDLNLVKRHGPPKLIKQGKDFPFVIVSPQCPENTRWQPEVLIALLDEIIDEYKIDKNRIYVTGLSMGGNGTWRLASEIPERLAAIIPICGWGDPFAVCMMGKLPIWTFHGAKDNVVPITSTDILVDRLKACNGNVEYTIYPEADHDSWTETYNNQKIYEWLLSHSLEKDKRIVRD